MDVVGEYHCLNSTRMNLTQTVAVDGPLEAERLGSFGAPPAPLPLPLKAERVELGSFGVPKHLSNDGLLYLGPHLKDEIW